MSRLMLNSSLLIGSAAALVALGMHGTNAAAPRVAPVPAAVVDVVHTNTPAAQTEVAYLAGGCFWGLEAVFEHTKGVVDVVSGYSGGTVVNPSYEQVSSGDTGHAETVKITYDPSKVTYGQLLRVYFSVATDPTELNRQGPDEGTQYRGVIFYTSDEQKKVAEAYIAQLTAAHTFSKPIVTQLVPFSKFYEAEAYHQDFAARNPNYPYIVYNDAPKVARLKKELPELYKDR